MTLCARLAVVCVATLAVVAPAGSAPAATAAAPKSLHGFTLRADEALTHTFARTPAFAWNPVPGAVTYEFELATSKSFSDSGTIWSTKGLKTPAVAVPISLPWITGNPYSLYAHVRAITGRGAGPWSVPFGFTMRWVSAPTPLPASPGLLRWSTVSGANGYEVWMLDAGHRF